MGTKLGSAVSLRWIDRALKARLSRLPSAQKGPGASGSGHGKPSWRLPHGILGRIAIGFAAIAPLFFGVLGCWVCYVDRNFERAHRTFVDCTLSMIMVDLSVLVVLTSSVTILWAIAAPNWVERLYETLVKKTMFGLTLLLIPLSACIWGCIMCIRLR